MNGNSTLKTVLTASLARCWRRSTDRVRRDLSLTSRTRRKGNKATMKTNTKPKTAERMDAIVAASRNGRYSSDEWLTGRALTGGMTIGLLVMKKMINFKY